MGSCHRCEFSWRGPTNGFIGGTSVGIRRDPIGRTRASCNGSIAQYPGPWGGGEVVLAGINQASGPMARILALDRGAGIANMAQAMADGYSTSGTMGGGLGAMKRIAMGLDIFSNKSGTIVMLEVGAAQ